MTRKLSMIIGAVMMAVLASCSSGNFTIEGELTDAGTQNLRFVYASEGNITSQWIPAVGGRLTLEGNSKELTVVYVFTAQMKYLTHVAVKNGETIRLSGKISDPWHIKAEGSDINAEWTKFILAHAADFAAGATDKTDKAIEQYIKANPTSVVSTLLLTCDYSQITSDRAQTLLESIAEEARPASLLEPFASTIGENAMAMARVQPMSLLDRQDSLVIVDVKKKRLNVLYFWHSTAEADSARRQTVKGLREMTGGDVAIIDICINPDTLGWARTVRSDSLKATHYKALQGPVDKGLLPLNIKGENFIIVADSTGRQLYRGTSTDEARKTIINNPNARKN